MKMKFVMSVYILLSAVPLSLSAQTIENKDLKVEQKNEQADKLSSSRKKTVLDEDIYNVASYRPIEISLNAGVVFSSSDICSLDQCENDAPLFGISFRNFFTDSIYLTGGFTHKGTRKGRSDLNNSRFDYLESNSFDFGAGYRYEFNPEFYLDLESTLSYIQLSVDGDYLNQSYNKRYEQVSPSLALGLGYRVQDNFSIGLSARHVFQAGDLNITDNDIFISLTYVFGGNRPSHSTVVSEQTPTAPVTAYPPINNNILTYPYMGLSTPSHTHDDRSNARNLDRSYRISFDVQSSTLSEEFIELLDDIVEEYTKKPFNITIIGSADSLGENFNNDLLSKKRAQSVENYLTSNGVRKYRLSTYWTGKTMTDEKDSYYRSVFLELDL
ncbi:OmpA family protein [Vibrio chagasii]|uniref:OmpA family protein n=1 Tax=Vibrio chagasii TaxID=170679 RepID=UPI003DAA4827